jgi:hypothetical protein
LKHQFDIALDKKKIHLEHTIRALGEYEVALHLHAEVKGTLKVRVESLTPMAAPAPEAAPVEFKTEKRGRRPERAEKTEAAEAKPKAAKAVDKAERPVKAPKVEKKAK